MSAKRWRVEYKAQQEDGFSAFYAESFASARGWCRRFVADSRRNEAQAAIYADPEGRCFAAWRNEHGRAVREVLDR